MHPPFFRKVVDFTTVTCYNLKKQNKKEAVKE